MEDFIFEPDVEFEWEVGVDREIHFEPAPKDERKRHKTGYRGIVYRERADGSRNYAYYNNTLGRYVNGFKTEGEALVERSRWTREAEARRLAFGGLPGSLRSKGSTPAAGRGGVYFIQPVDGGPIKIGWTGGTPKSRLATLQTGSPLTLRVIGWIPCGDQKLEKELHRRLRFWRLHGEWFESCRELHELLTYYEKNYRKRLPADLPADERTA